MALFSHKLALCLGFIIFSLSCAPLSWALPEKEVSVQKVTVEQTRFIIKKADGTLVKPEELIEAQLVASNDKGIQERYRIDRVVPESSKKLGKIYLYQFSVQDPVSGTWKNLCEPDQSGRALGFPLTGYWDQKGVYHSTKDSYHITCTSSTIGKCALWGYADPSLNKHLQACVRMVRADYCGDGTSYTKEGIEISIQDNLNIKTSQQNPKLTFEATWNENGAVCLEKTRIPEIISLEGIQKKCPNNIEINKNCEKDFQQNKALLRNKS
jgi:hypothetical protein